MPNPVLRALLAVDVVVAAMLFGGIGAGVAIADPDTSDVSDPGVSADAPTVNEPQPTTPTTSIATESPTIFDIPNTVIGGLRDFFGRPLSVFGNGRVPGTHTLPDGDRPKPERDTATAEKPDKPERPETPDQQPAAPEPSAPAVSDSADSSDSPPAPAPAPVPRRWTMSSSDRLAVSTPVRDTLDTVNSLLWNCFAPTQLPASDPTPNPEPDPEPESDPDAEPGPVAQLRPATTFRIFQEEPVLDAGDATVPSPVSTGSSELTVLQAPVLIPQARFDVPAPVRALANSAGRTRVLTVVAPTEPSPAKASAPAQTRPGQADPVQPSPAETNPALTNRGPGSAPPREGYPRYLRAARTNQLAGLAIPGLAGLIALTASGGVIGYRQANSGRYLRTEAARFLA